MEDKKIERARELMAAGRYDAARRILQNIADNPVAIGLLSTIEQIALPKRKQDDDDIYRQEEAMQYRQPKDKGRVVQPETGEPRNYILLAFVTWGAYMFFWPIGIFLNIHFLREAREAKRMWGNDAVDGEGCLWTLFIVHVVGVVLLIGFVLIVTQVIATGY